MEKKELDSLVVKRRKKKTTTVGFRLDDRLIEKLKEKGIDIPATVRAVLERLAG